MGLDEEDYGVSSGIAEAAGEVVEKTAFLPDYGFKDKEGGTSFSGIVGSIIVCGVAVGIGLAGGFFRKKKVD